MKNIHLTLQKIRKNLTNNTTVEYGTQNCIILYRESFLYISWITANRDETALHRKAVKNILNVESRGERRGCPFHWEVSYIIAN